MPGPTPEFWNARFAEPELAYGDAPNDFLAEFASRLPIGRTLCLAEGQGRNAIFLAELGHDVLAVDLSEVGLNRAQDVATRRGVTIRTEVADLGAYTIEPEAWDTIVSIFAHVPADARRRLHAQIAQGLKPGGAFILEAYTPAQAPRTTGGPGVQAIDITMTAQGLREEIAGLDIEHLQELERTVIEGPYHTGAAAIVQMLAWKSPTPAR
ncbi:MAG: class I SAM-dependent methyltransferase [Bacteroidota bacterium]